MLNIVSAIVEHFFLLLLLLVLDWNDFDIT